MDFLLSEDQTLLKNSVARFCADQAKAPADERRWAQMAGLGLLGMTFDEDHGGMGAGAPEVMIVAEEMGRHLLTDPFVQAVAIAGRLIDAAGSAAQKDALLPAIAEGRLVVVPAFGEPGSRYDLARVAATATADGGGHVLNGRKAVVLYGAAAHSLLVSARVSGAVDAPDGIALFLVDARAPGLMVRACETLDGRPAAEVTLDRVRVGADALLGPPGGAFGLLEHAADRGVAAVCGEAVGAMAALYDMTVEFLRTRRQFGRPLGAFQALQHRVVDMRTALELARSMAAAAAIAADLDDAGERRRIVSAAKVQVDRSGRAIGAQAIQLHGAMGMTEEYGAGRYVKRLLVLSSLYGDADHHTDRYQAATGLAA
ncbi:MAG TPA: acyl-CoA dehydrogenase family protein [Azospirillum sp.]|nr:acyl-CoA dehydrogenase family protein [Azospirillum sp.]